MIFVARSVQPRSLSIGRGLSFVARVALLGGLDLVGAWPELISSHSIRCRGCVLMAFLFVGAGAAVVLRADRMMAMGPTVVAHVARVFELASAA